MAQKQASNTGRNLVILAALIGGTVFFARDPDATRIDTRASPGSSQPAADRLVSRNCGPAGSDAAFNHVADYLRSTGNFYRLAMHKAAIKRHVGGCSHEVMGSAERGSMPGNIKSYAAEVSFDAALGTWVIDKIDADQ
jgi:hypothetical protein